MVSLAALAAIPILSSFPTGFGFGAGYGAGVRVGYDIIYPWLASKFSNQILGLISQTGPPPEPGGDLQEPTRRFDEDGPSDFPDTDFIRPTRRRTGRDEIVGQDNGACVAQHRRWRNLMTRSAKLTVEIKHLKTKQRATTGRQNTAFSLTRANKIKERLDITDELNAAINNPNNQTCASTFETS